MDDELLALVLKAAQIVTRLCGPLDSDLSYYQAIYPDIIGVEEIQKRSSKVLYLTKSIIDATGIHVADGSEDEARQDAFDALLEEFDHQFDVMNGQIKAPKIQVREPQKLKRFQTAPSHMKVLRPDDISIYQPTSNPYADTIKSLSYESYCTSNDDEVEKYKDLNDTPLIWIDVEKSLDEMIETLSKVSIIAVDLEHHSMHSYQGITCLMQISTMNADYLIDTIKLRKSIPKLTTILSNPTILKVMHGAESDNNWLQRDFNIFLVNLFDTYFAAKALNYERFSFAFLSEKITGVYIDKQHQMSDWRVRPLPEDMQLYARQDTHYLLYIFEKLRRELFAKSKEALLGVFNRSAHQCLQLFKAEKFDVTNWKSIISGSNVPFNRIEYDRVKAIYEWRDIVARKEDVSHFALMPNPVIIKLAQTKPEVDILPVLKSSRHDLALSIQNIDSLKEALSKVSIKALPQKRSNHIPSDAKPEHIIFKDSEDEDSVPVKAEEQVERKHKIQIATELKKKSRKGCSLADAFKQAPQPPLTVDTAPILAQMDISRVARAAQLLAEAENMQELVVEIIDEEEVENPVEKEAVVLKTGTTFSEKEVLSQATQKFEFNFASSKSKKSAGAKPVEVFDYSTASIPSTIELKKASVKAAKKEFKPTIESAHFPKNPLGPRIPTQPRSGNRSQTFSK